MPEIRIALQCCQHSTTISGHPVVQNDQARNVTVPLRTAKKRDYIRAVHQPLNITLLPWPFALLQRQLKHFRICPIVLDQKDFISALSLLCHNSKIAPRVPSGLPRCNRLQVFNKYSRPDRADQCSGNGTHASGHIRLKVASYVQPQYAINLVSARICLDHDF